MHQLEAKITISDSQCSRLADEDAHAHASRATCVSVSTPAGFDHRWAGSAIRAASERTPRIGGNAKHQLLNA